jgi:hypothetical protein
LRAVRESGEASAYLLEIAERAVADEHRVVLDKGLGRLLWDEDDLENRLERRRRALDVPLVGSAERGSGQRRTIEPLRVALRTGYSACRLSGTRGALPGSA